MNGAFTRIAAAFAVFVLLADGVRGEDCSRTCVATNCNNFAVNYGKYCGIGYYGCPGEPPCDDLDACCKVHDNCVGEKGMTYIRCHEQFLRCLNRLSRAIKRSNNKKVGFSAECPYSVAIPTMFQGMNLGIFFSGIGNPVQRLRNGTVVTADLSKSGANTEKGLGVKERVNVTLETQEGRPKAKATASLDTNSSLSDHPTRT